MLLAILIISLFVYAWGLFREYYISQNSLIDTEDVASFNEQFANYDRNGVLGYELVTLINRVVDYNTRESRDDAAVGNDKYVPITIIMNFGDENKRKKLTKDDTLRLFAGVNSLTYTQSNTQNQLKHIIDFANEIEERYGGSDAATRIAKSIDSIFLANDTENWNTAINKFNSFSTKLQVQTIDQLKAQKDDAYKYYEYVQFKRAKFNSISSEIKYDDATGRLYKMVFEFTGNIY